MKSSEIKGCERARLSDRMEERVDTRKSEMTIEDGRDNQIARDRLAEIESDPKVLVRGKKLKKWLDNLLW